MDTPIRIHDRGESFVLSAAGPPTTARAQAARVAKLLERVGHIVRPLCVELAAGPLDPDTAFVEDCDRFVQISERLPPEVAATHGRADVPVQIVQTFGPGAIARAIEACGGLLGRLDALAILARVYDVHGERVAVEGVSAGAPVFTRGPNRWLAGPLAAPGAPLSPPLTLSIEQTFEALVLTIETRWSPWLTEGRPELERLRALTAPDRA